ncbi:hypothetical protein [Streptomyces sp. NPDC049040]|uniref:hypothetical protein n=1 Tax=Streptomyces sp. NPDC049040 TaxID=3365593 RepID=UPI003715BEE4
MSMVVVGLFYGLASAFAGWYGGFEAFILVAGLGAIGFVVGKFADGDLRVDEFIRSGDRDRRR